MPQEIPCPKCGQILSVADDSPDVVFSCPNCQTPIDVPGVKTAGEKTEVPIPSVSNPPPAEVPSRKWMGTLSPGVPPVFFRFLLPVLTVSCISGIVITYPDRRDVVNFIIFFGYLEILAVAQMVYWASQWKRSGPEAGSSSLRGGLVAGCLAVLAPWVVMIFLFATCSFLLR